MQTFSQIKIKIIIIVLFIFITSFLYYFLISINLLLKNGEDINYKTSKFAILYRRCPYCGLFSFFITSLGCINKYFKKGYIPIINFKCFPNVLNGNKLYYNLWETFFEQPFNFTLEKVLQNAENVEYIRCDGNPAQPNDNIFKDKIKTQFWHNIANKFMPIKRNIINLSKKIMQKLFRNSTNILGVLIRGIDYISIRPEAHPIQPTVETVIYDVKQMEISNTYDWIFFTTEDEYIRNKFIKALSKKIKQLNSFSI